MKTLQIPADLTAEEALSSTALLEQIVNAIWAQHGDAMLDRLDRQHRIAAVDPRCPICRPDIGDDNLPF